MTNRPSAMLRQAPRNTGGEAGCRSSPAFEPLDAASPDWLRQCSARSRAAAGQGADVIADSQQCKINGVSQ